MYETIVANIHALFPRCNILVMKLHAGTIFIGCNTIVYQMMHGINNNKLVSWQLSDNPVFFIANGFPFILLWYVVCRLLRGPQNRKGKGKIIHNKEKMITRQLKEFSTQEIISQPQVSCNMTPYSARCRRHKYCYTDHPECQQICKWKCWI